MKKSNNAIPIGEISKFPQHIQDQINQQIGVMLGASENKPFTAQKEPNGTTPSKSGDVPNSHIMRLKARHKSNSGTDTIALVLKSLGIAYETEYKFHPTRRWRFDFAIPEKRLAVEYEGIYSEKSRHTTTSGYTGDVQKYNQATIAGWRVLRYTAKNLKFIKEDLKEILHGTKE